MKAQAGRAGRKWPTAIQAASLPLTRPALPLAHRPRLPGAARASMAA
ncbi:hypothetical protein [Roseateles sp. LYH14W]|uniref:Uncharacterized protein n=1 Tax=Pelomonas parva TaxID=3299032 RepID=A0ABW7F940_9BURK